MTEIEKSNFIEMSGCKEDTLEGVLKKATGKVIMSSAGWYTDFMLLDNSGLLAIFTHDGILKHTR